MEKWSRIVTFVRERFSNKLCLKRHQTQPFVLDVGGEFGWGVILGECIRFHMNYLCSLSMRWIRFLGRKLLS